LGQNLAALLGSFSPAICALATTLGSLTTALCALATTLRSLRPTLRHGLFSPALLRRAIVAYKRDLIMTKNFLCLCAKRMSQKEREVGWLHEFFRERSQIDAANAVAKFQSDISPGS
jgi:hypothetical protein